MIQETENQPKKESGSAWKSPESPHHDQVETVTLPTGVPESEAST